MQVTGQTTQKSVFFNRISLEDSFGETVQREAESENICGLCASSKRIIFKPFRYLCVTLRTH